MGNNVGSGMRSKMRFSPLKAFFPTADDVIGADRENLGGTLLRHLKTYEGGGTVHQPVGGFNRDYYVGVMEGRQLGLGPLPTQPEYADRQAQVSRRMQEAWNWAVIEGYLMRTPGQPHPDFFILTTEGERILDEVLLFVYPILLGRGKRFFSEGAPPCGLALASTNAVSSGVLINTYTPVGTPRTAKPETRPA